MHSNVLKFSIFLFFITSSISNLYAQKNVIFEVYKSDGTIATYENMLEELSHQDIVFFGELHNSSIGHWLELELEKDLFEKKKGKLILGAEMFESDNQLIMDEYLGGFFNTKKFQADSRLWKNYSTDYKPLVEFAKEKELPFIATNIPRRYASMVFKKGVDSLALILSEDAKKYIAPLPFPFDTIPSYKSLIEMMSDHSGGLTFAKAQAIKDATMAHFILKNMKKDHLFLHFNGSYHSMDHEGILWQINQLTHKYSQMSINLVEQDNLKKLLDENINTADFIIVIPSNFTKTY